MCIRCDDDKPAFKHDLCKPCWATVFGPAWDEAKAKADKWGALVEYAREHPLDSIGIYLKFEKLQSEPENDADE